MKAKLLFNLIFLGVAVAVGVALGMRPWPVYQEQRRQADGYRRDAMQAESKRYELERQRAKYESPLGQEELARQAGHKKKGESDLFPGG